ncbi:MAG: ATP-binding cassette domain-containing protein [Verrucomicrobia bacterium]|nr:ATP-binding cassette domain-containing protein [Verrucomicrobiota bacterium]
MSTETKSKPPFFQTLRQAWTPYRRLYGYVRPYQWRFIFGLVLGFAYGAVSGLLPLVLQKVTTTIFHGAAPSATDIAHRSQLLNAGGSIKAIIGTCLLIPAVMTVRSLVAYGNTYYMNWVSNRVVSDIRYALFSKMVRQSMSFFNRNRAGMLISRITNDTMAMQAALTTVSSDAFKQPISIVFAVSVLLYMDWKFTVATLVLFPSCILPLQVFGKRARKSVQNQNENMGEMVVTMQETFSGIRVVKSFAREQQQIKRFGRSTMIQFRNAMRMIKATEITGPLIETLAAVGVGLALLYVYVAGLSAGRFLALIGGIFILYDPVKTLSKIHIIMQRSIAATEGVFAVLDAPSEVVDAPDAQVLPSSRGRLQFENVTFRYAGTSADAVRNLNLQIDPGKTYALVGASGAGKSTILSLILRLYDPSSGVIRLDGIDLRTITQESLRQQIGLVSQDTFLFHDTVYNNILFGRLDAEREEVYAAAQAAYAHDFIMAQPNGYDTIVGDKGMLLSGGQQQRIAIARAVLKNAPILLLDEATSALDSESEQQIQLALQKLAAGKTVVAIAHRLSTILSSDQIVVMDRGLVKEIGTHGELLAKSGYYRRLYDLQFKGGAEHKDPEPEELFEVVG